MKSQLTATFTLPDIEAFIQSKLQQANQAVINAYKFAGETFVREARLKTAATGGFNDITGNLRSSIGYIIINNGKQLVANFEESGIGTDKATGIATGIQFAEEVAAEFTKGLALICVAGMGYAAAVESKGKDVITGSTLELSTQLKELLSQI